MDALFIHTGVNDVENDLLDAKTIADHLTKVVLNAREKFPETKLFLLEVTLRSDGFNKKVLKINSVKELSIQYFKFETGNPFKSSRSNLLL